MTGKLRTIWEEYQEIILLTFFIGIFSFVMATVNRYSRLEGMYFFLFQICCIIVPGMALILLLRLKKITKLEFAGLSYAAGYSLNLVMYYLFVPFGLKDFLLYGFIVLFLVSIFVIIKNRSFQRDYEREHFGTVVCFIVLLIVVCVEALTICTSNFFPPNVAENQIFNDMLYWTGDTITLAKGYPAYFFRKYPRYPYTYHFFSAMQVSVISLVTSIRPVFLCLGYSFIQPVILVTFGGYIFFRRMTDKKALLLAAMFILYFVEGSVDLTNVSYTLHLLIAPFGFDVGMGLSLFFWWVLFRQIQTQRFCPRLLFLSLLFFMATLGAKSPFGAVGLAAMGIACLVWLFRRDFKRALGYGIPVLAAFVVMYVFVVNMKNSDQPENSLLATLQMTPHIYNRLSDLLKVAHERWTALCPLPFLLPVFELVFCVFGMISSNYCVYIIFFFCIFLKAGLLKKWDLFDTLCVTAAFTGALVTMNWGNPDFSVAYFMLTTYIVCIAFSLRALHTMLEESNFFTRARRIMYASAALLLILCGFREAVISNNTLGTRIERGWQALWNRESITADSTVRDYISANDYDACEWIRVNTPNETIITGNKGLQLGRNESSRHTRMTGVFTERYVVTNEDSDAMFFDLEYDKIKSLKELGVSYILYNTTATEGFELPKEYGEIVYFNNTNVVYELR